MPITKSGLMRWRANEHLFTERQRALIPRSWPLGSKVQALHPEYGEYFQRDLVTNYVFSSPLRPQLCLADRLVVDIHPHQTPESFFEQYRVTPDEMTLLIDDGRVLPVFHADMERYEGLSYLGDSGIWNESRPSNVRTDALFEMVAPEMVADGIARYSQVERRHGIPRSRSWSARYRTGDDAYRKATMVRLARLHALAPAWFGKFRTPPSPSEIAVLASWFIAPTTKALGCLHTVDERVYRIVKPLPPDQRAKRVPANELVVAKALLRVLDAGRPASSVVPDEVWTREFSALVQQVVDKEKLSDADLTRARQVANRLGVEWAASARKNRSIQKQALSGATFLARMSGKGVLSLGLGPAIAIFASGLGAASFIKRFATHFGALTDAWPEVGAWRFFRLDAKRRAE
jgi:hypothetical protein